MATPASQGHLRTLAPLLCQGLLVNGADCPAHGATFSMAHGHDGT